MDLGTFNPITNWPVFVGGGLILFAIWFFDQVFAPISPLPYGLIGFFGNRGRGKTFTAVAYARRWRHQHPNAAVYTNLDKLKLPGTGPIYLSCTMEQITQARDCLVLIDEAGVFLNAWNYVAENQRKTARWIAATRHFGVIVLMTAHLPEHINKRIRDVLDEMYYMESFQGMGVFRATVYESSAGIKKNKPTKTVWIPKLPTVCNAYDTNALRSRADIEGVDMVGTDEQMLSHRIKSIDDSIDSDNQTTTTSAEEPKELSWSEGLAVPTKPKTKAERVAAYKAKKQAEKECADTAVVTELQAVENATIVGDIADVNAYTPVPMSIEEISVSPDNYWEIRVTPSVTKSDMTYVSDMIHWFRENGGDLHEIILPNIEAYNLVKQEAPTTKVTVVDPTKPYLSDEEWDSEMKKAMVA